MADALDLVLKVAGSNPATGNFFNISQLKFKKSSRELSFEVWEMWHKILEKELLKR